MAEGKIFGIGLGKTGTHSLTKAMSILGYKAKHHPHGRNLNKWIDSYDFLSDIIIAWQFEFLDYNYPNSRFIWCTRNMEEWLYSYRSSESSYGSFHTRQSRFMLYGTTEFDEHKFTSAYYDYNERVAEHFLGKRGLSLSYMRTFLPDRLLVMDICSGDGWERLCNWLGREIPEEDFPHLGSREKRKERAWT